MVLRNSKPVDLAVSMSNIFPLATSVFTMRDSSITTEARVTWSSLRNNLQPEINNRVIANKPMVWVIGLIGWVKIILFLIFCK